MRIWSLHPKYLDQKGLVAVWRETLLAQKVLQGSTKGYTRHPQLTRFRGVQDPVIAVASYLHGIADEADVRGYRFNRSRIFTSHADDRTISLPVTNGQIAYEWRHLLDKLAIRDTARHANLQALAAPTPHPLFFIVEGEIESWERL